MRNHDELLAEARRIGALGELFADEHRSATLAGRTVRPRVIETFLAPPALPRERWTEVDMIDGALEYRLIETSGRDSSPRTLVVSESAFDVLAEGDEIEEKEGLTEKLTPLVVRIGRADFDDSLEASVVQEVEAMLDAGELDPAAQLKTRAEIMDFLAGEIEPSRLAAAVVERRSQR
ncbi:MAG TPA: hypothetical protein VGE52_06865, partial [Pirellulales bacterium]